MAPTKTAIEWVSGRVGRYWDSRMVGASAESAGFIQQTDQKTIRKHTNFDGVGGEMVCDGILR